MATVDQRKDSLGVRWAIWGTCVALWTLVLLTPEPVHVMRDTLPPQATYPTAKTGHIAVYALLTILSAWLRLRSDRRWLLLVFLSLHGMATEFLQTFVPERSGSWIDVGFDHVGILLGLVLSWKWWRA